MVQQKQWHEQGTSHANRNMKRMMRPDSWKLVMVRREDLLENLAMTPVNVSWTGSTGLLEQSVLGTCVRRQGLQSSNHTSGVGRGGENHTPLQGFWVYQQPWATKTRSDREHVL